MASEGEQLRQRRERLGLSVAEVARSTGLPAPFVRAIEKGRSREAAPSPAYDDAWRRTLVRFLDRVERRVARGLDWDAHSSSQSSGSAPRGSTFPPSQLAGGVNVAVSVRSLEQDEGPDVRTSRIRRWLVDGSTALVGMVMIVWASQMVRHLQLPPKPPPDVGVSVKVLREVPMRVVVDGRDQLDRVVARGEELELSGQEVWVDVPDPFAIKVKFEGNEIQPRGHRSFPRRMVFVSEASGR